jgi:hypothetical protein
MIWITFNGFNHSVADAFWILVPLGIVVFIFAFRSVAHKKNGYYYFFDAKHCDSEKLKKENGEFGPHSQRYNDLAKLLIALSTGVIAFIVNMLVNEKGTPSATMTALSLSAPIVIGFLGSSATLLVLFMSLQAIWYEEYCNDENHATYNRWKYAICLTLGWTGLVSFGVGMFWLAANLF